MNRAERLAKGQAMFKQRGIEVFIKDTRSDHQTGLRFHQASNIGGHTKPCGCPRCKRARLAEIALYLAADGAVTIAGF